MWVTDGTPKPELHHDYGEACPFTVLLGLGKTVGGAEEEICINVRLHATFDAVR